VPVNIASGNIIRRIIPPTPLEKIAIPRLYLEKSCKSATLPSSACGAAAVGIYSSDVGDIPRLLGFEFYVQTFQSFFFDDRPAPGRRLAGRRGCDVQFYEIVAVLEPVGTALVPPVNAQRIFGQQPARYRGNRNGAGPQ
jgi:hypothetical protein